MITQSTKTILWAVFSIILVFVQSSCAAAGQPAPTETAAMKISTPTRVDTPTPETTATATSTPLPTATSTPSGTATQLPEITPPGEGKGNVAGLVLWNDQPVPKAAVWLCEKFDGGCLGAYQYRTNTDQNGYYVFTNVIPGTYLVAINSFSTGWFIFYFDSSGDREQEVSTGQTLVLDPWSIWKFDLRIISPRDGKDVADAHPTFQWEPYPDAAYYQFSIYDDKFETVLENKRVDGSEFTLEEATLVTCSYYWTVEAYNSNGVKISQVKTPISTVLKLIVHSIPGSC